MATQAQKSEILAITKQVNALKIRRNKLSKFSKYRKPILLVIKLAETDLMEKRTKYGL